MFIRLTILCCLLPTAPLHAQEMTLPQALLVAEGLEREQLLSTQGKLLLDTALTDGPAYIYDDAAYRIVEEGENLYTAIILSFLTDAYSQAFSFRSGMQLMSSIIAELPLDGSLPESKVQEYLEEEFKQRKPTHSGHILEDSLSKLRINSTVLLRSEPTIKYMSAGNVTDDLVPKTRSVLGYDVLTTLSAIQDLGLIDSVSYRTTVEEQRADGLRADYRVLQDLSLAAANRVMEPLRSQKRLDQLDKMIALRFIAEGQRDRLFADTAATGFRSPTAFVSYFSDQVPLNYSRIDNVSTYFDTLSAAICRIVPQICDLSVQITGKMDTLVGHDRPYLWFLVESSLPDRRMPNVSIRSLNSDGESFASQIDYSITESIEPYNNLLDTLNAEKRIYSVGMYQGDTALQSVYLLALTSQQVDSVKQFTSQDGTAYLSGPQAGSWLSPSAVSNHLDSLAEMGFFDSLSEMGQRNGRALATSKTMGNLLDIVRCFPALCIVRPDGTDTDSVIASDPLSNQVGAYYLAIPPKNDEEKEYTQIYLKLDDALIDYFDRNSHSLYLVNLGCD